MVYGGVIISVYIRGVYPCISVYIRVCPCIVTWYMVKLLYPCMSVYCSWYMVELLWFTCLVWRVTPLIWRITHVASLLLHRLLYQILLDNFSHLKIPLCKCTLLYLGITQCGTCCVDIQQILVPHAYGVHYPQVPSQANCCS